MEGHDAMLLGWYPSTPAYPQVDLPPGPQGPSTSNLVRLPPGDYPDLRTPIIHPHEPGDPAPPTSAPGTVVHPSVSCAQNVERHMPTTTHAVHLSHIVQPHVTQVAHLNPSQLGQHHVVQQMVASGVTANGHTVVQMVGVPTSSGNLSLTGTLQSAVPTSLIQVIDSPMDGPPFQCNECDHVAKTKRMLKRHLATVHSQERNYVCDYCSAKYKSRSGLRVHIIKHNVGKHKCEHCDKLFPYKGALDEHMKVVHEDFRFKCTWEGCEFTTTSKYLLKGHVSYNHEGGKYVDNKFRKKCSYCNYIGYDIRGHESAMHGLEPRFECPTCKKKFHFGSNLRQHKKVHLPMDQYPFVCDVCGDRFLRRRQLEDHFIGKHTNEKPHLCVKCGFSCASRRTMSDHVAANCYEKEAAFRCKFCSFETKIPFTMRTHKEKCHAKNQTKRKKQRKAWQSDSDECEEDLENANKEPTAGDQKRLQRNRRKPTDNYMPWSVRPEGVESESDQEQSAKPEASDSGVKVAPDGSIAVEGPSKKRGRPPKNPAQPKSVKTSVKKATKTANKAPKRKAPKRRTWKKQRKSTSEDDDAIDEPFMSDIEEEDDEEEERMLLNELEAGDSDSGSKKRKTHISKSEFGAMQSSAEDKTNNDEQPATNGVGNMDQEINEVSHDTSVQNAESQAVERRGRPPKRKAAIAALERTDDGSNDELFEEPPMIAVGRKPAKKRALIAPVEEKEELDIVCENTNDNLMVMNCSQCMTFFVSSDKFEEHMQKEHQFQMMILTN